VYLRALWWHFAYRAYVDGLAQEYTDNFTYGIRICRYIWVPGGVFSTGAPENVLAAVAAYAAV
jgi:hypothetical protein